MIGKQRVMRKIEILFPRFCKFLFAPAIFLGLDQGIRILVFSPSPTTASQTI
jgi:hypothetical protein